MAKKKGSGKKPTKRKKPSPRKKAAPRKKVPAKKRLKASKKTASKKARIPAKKKASRTIAQNRHPQSRGIPKEGMAGNEPPILTDPVVFGTFVLRQVGEFWFCMEQRPDNSLVEHDRFKTREKALKHMRNEHS